MHIRDLKSTTYDIIYKIGKITEAAARNLRPLPQYKYVARPIYNALGGNRNPYFSVPATFFAMDILFHRLLPLALATGYMLATDDSSYFDQQLANNLGQTGMLLSLSWIAIGIPVALVKSNRIAPAPNIQWDNESDSLENDEIARISHTPHRSYFNITG